jgi:hypothetical protein
MILKRRDVSRLFLFRQTVAYLNRITERPLSTALQAQENPARAVMVNWPANSVRDSSGYRPRA